MLPRCVFFGHHNMCKNRCRNKPKHTLSATLGRSSDELSRASLFCLRRSVRCTHATRRLSSTSRQVCEAGCITGILGCCCPTYKIISVLSVYHNNEITHSQLVSALPRHTHDADATMPPWANHHHPHLLHDGLISASAPKNTLRTCVRACVRKGAE